ncbi:hypothetical protein FPQ18DRAFT_328980 [Pyronema domesticum]|uniref:Luciferase domain-containing protein n=1 Tax=Pyronema omphalodes (strain CBS 100304) TaxID=1076935 RepID=U4KX12_PYROM|nr:hypothetical protein FPQ18DRAFT_328980 [Pyronema domesticum]CCX06271.1 Similar to hypothetical protein [Tuber melanosporum Mel28]; acc. no. XP_002839810 [Pyronema omphalodes CBS 100304]
MEFFISRHGPNRTTATLNRSFLSEAGSRLFVLPRLHPELIPVALALAIPTLILFAYFVYQDYLAFLALGPGGTPSTPLGYLRICLLKVFALRNTLKCSPIPDHLRNTGFLRDPLPARRSARPVVVGIAPHRQKSQNPSATIYETLSNRIKQLAVDFPEKLEIKVSAFEKHCAALFSRASGLEGTKGRGEVCHAHDSDGSMHMTLHPEDIKRVVEAGWGERHPLARGGFFCRFVPQEFIMVYAPRTEEEVEIVMQIIYAGIGWISGEEFPPVPRSCCGANVSISVNTGRNGTSASVNVNKGPVAAASFVAPGPPHPEVDERVQATAS